jgi:hypothetical protein
MTTVTAIKRPFNKEAREQFSEIEKKLGLEVLDLCTLKVSGSSPLFT